MSLVGSYTDIAKVDVNVVNVRITELEKRIGERKKSVLATYNAKLDATNKSFLGDASKGKQPDDTALAYLKKIKELHAEFKEKY